MELILIDIGACFIRIGQVGELVPRQKFLSVRLGEKSIQSFVNENSCLDTFPPGYGTDDKALTDVQRGTLVSSFLETPLHKKVSKIFSFDQDSLKSSRDFQIQTYLQESLESLLLLPTHCKAILIEPAYISKQEKDHITEILLSNLKFSSISWISEPVMEVVAAGLSDSLVVHLGWLSAVVVSVVDLRVVCSLELSSTHTSGLALHYKIVEKWLELGNDRLDLLLSSASGFELVENFIQTSVFIRKNGSTEDNLSFKQYRINEEITIPKFICYEIAELLASELASEILSFITKCAIDVRSRILDNIIFVGGLASIPGLKSYVLSQIRQEWKSSNSKVSLGSWPGSSIYFSSLEREELKQWRKRAELTREQFFASSMQHQRTT